jgi:RNA polymerase sigma factor (sigma-70 family)
LGGGPDHEAAALRSPPGRPPGRDDGDEALAGRAGRGDSGALSLLLLRWHEPLVRYCRRILTDEDEARDLAQDTLLKVTRALPRFDPSRPFAAWIYRIARNACLNHLERRRLRGRPEVPADRVGPTPRPDQLAARREEADRVREALAGLPRADRELLRMKLVTGLDNAEISRRLGLTPGALRTRACRALARLRARLGGGREEER